VSDLAALAARYVSIPSVSGDEAAICDDIEATLRAAPHLEVTRIGDNLVARTTGTAPTRLVLAGHLDTVPGELGHRAVDGDGVLRGLGACDMKGSLAAMVALGLEGPHRGSEATYVFYAREEVARADSGLLELLAVAPELLAGDAAVLCEPTSCVVEAGCQGVVRLDVVLAGQRAHTARPWRGRNAIHRLAPLLAAVAAYVPRSVEIDGVTYTEQLQVVRVDGGVSANVVPDRASVTLNHRVAPDRSTDDAVAALLELLGPHLEDTDAVEVTDAADPAAPTLSHPALARLVELSGAPPRAKLGYTDVATFSAIGVPAANFGAGDPELAHHAGELVEVREIERCREVLAALLESPLSPVG